MGDSGRFDRTHEPPKLGARYGELLVTGLVRGPKGGVRGVECRCSCGRSFVVAESNLRHGRTTRCAECGRAKGNQRRVRYKAVGAEHRRRLNGRISSILGRCLDPSHRQYRQYGSRGVLVHLPWIENREEFMRYLTTLDGWDNPQLTIDRIDNDRGYEPGNLRFVSIQRQQQNRTNTRWVTYAGERMSASDFWRRFCPRYARVGTVLRKLSEGRTPQQIIDEQKLCRGAYGLRHSELRAS